MSVTSFMFGNVKRDKRGNIIKPKVERPKPEPPAKIGFDLKGLSGAMGTNKNGVDRRMHSKMNEHFRVMLNPRSEIDNRFKAVHKVAGLIETRINSTNNRINAITASLREFNVRLNKDYEKRREEYKKLHGRDEYTNAGTMFDTKLDDRKKKADEARKKRAIRPKAKRIDPVSAILGMSGASLAMLAMKLVKPLAVAGLGMYLYSKRKEIANVANPFQSYKDLPPADREKHERADKRINGGNADNLKNMREFLKEQKAKNDARDKAQRDRINERYKRTPKGLSEAISGPTRIEMGKLTPEEQKRLDKFDKTGRMNLGGPKDQFAGSGSLPKSSSDRIDMYREMRRDERDHRNYKFSPNQGMMKLGGTNSQSPAEYAKQQQMSQFMKFGQLPPGFEHVAGNRGILGKPMAVAASGAQPFAFSGGSPGGSYSAGGTPSTSYNMPTGEAPRVDLGGETTGSGPTIKVDDKHPLTQQRTKLGGNNLNRSQKLHFYALMMAEIGPRATKKDFAALMETPYNRGVTEKDSNIMQNLTPAYYEPLRKHRGGYKNYQRYLSQLKKDPKLFAKLDSAHNEVIRGSNYSKLATQNSSAGVAASARRTQTVTGRTTTGETLSRKDKMAHSRIHGLGTVQNTQSWVKSTSAALKSYEAAASRATPEEDLTQSAFVDEMKPGASTSDKLKKPSFDYPTAPPLKSKSLDSYMKDNIRKATGKTDPASNKYIDKWDKDEKKLVAGKERFFYRTGSFRGKPDQALINVMKSASRDLPSGYRVEMISGKDGRSTGTRNHPNGLAVDVKIVDAEGKDISHQGFDKRGFQVYEKLYRSVRIRGKTMYPKEEWIWGGAWISKAAGYGDRMHYQRKVKGVGSQSSGRYNWERGVPSSHPASRAQMAPHERKAYDAKIQESLKGEVSTKDGTAKMIVPDELQAAYEMEQIKKRETHAHGLSKKAPIDFRKVDHTKPKVKPEPTKIPEPEPKKTAKAAAIDMGDTESKATIAEKEGEAVRKKAADAKSASKSKYGGGQSYGGGTPNTNNVEQETPKAGSSGYGNAGRCWV